MKIPKKVKIGGHWVTVKMAKAENIKGLLGDFESGKNLIRIANMIEPSQQEETLLHEIVEWISGCNELGLTHPQVQGVASGLYQVLKDNKLRF